nr:NAC domain-containing protein [Tanacetum cinerariifolium]
MFKNFKREDLEVLRSIVKERFKKAKLVDDMDNLLFQTLKTMFETHVEDIIWKYQQGAVKVNNWKLFHSCGVYCVTTKNMMYYLLVEKMYPFTNNILHQLWSDVRLQVDYEVEMAYDLLRLIKRQINKGSMARNENNLLSVPRNNEEEVKHDYLSTLPLGYRFCPTASEIIVYYLMTKIKTGTKHPGLRLYEVNFYNYHPDQLA